MKNRYKIVLILMVIFQNCVSKTEQNGVHFDSLGGEAPNMELYHEISVEEMKDLQEYYDSLNYYKENN